jgi:DNA processing protein
VTPDDSWLALLYASDPSRRHWHAALRTAGTAAALVAKPASELAAFGLKAAAIHRAHRPARDVIAHWQRWLKEPQRELITLGSPAYPQRLAEIPDPPLALWVRGAHTELLAAPQVAVVGSRNPTANGRVTAETFAEFFSASGITVTSGLAVGIDAAAHRGALRACGGTVAVLGCGIDTIYPRCNETLAAEITASGVVVSEYPPGTPVRARRFPERNRIIAGLSLGTLVVEAARRSGSLITARHATECGREVFAVPGSIHSPLSRGCHWLLRNGAMLVEESSEVLVELFPLLERESISRPAPTSVASTRCDDPMYAKLVKSLGFAPVRVEDLLAGSGLTAAELSSMLLLLELEGHVEALPGGRYCRLAKRS